MRGRLYRAKTFVTVTAHIIDGKGIMLECWVSPALEWANKKIDHDLSYNYSGDDIGVVIQSNIELTVNAVNMVGEFVEAERNRILLLNNNRKLANR
jgi:hypothetical protein